MSKKLIDWGTVPKGTQTSFGELLAYKDNHCEVYWDYRMFSNRYDIEQTNELRLAPADQQPWLPYEERVTVIPEWADITYRGYMRGRVGLHELSYKDGLDYFHSYKIIGIKDGWTDNTDEVTE